MNRIKNKFWILCLILQNTKEDLFLFSALLLLKHSTTWIVFYFIHQHYTNERRNFPRRMTRGFFFDFFFFLFCLIHLIVLICSGFLVKLNRQIKGKKSEKFFALVRHWAQGWKLEVKGAGEGKEKVKRRKNKENEGRNIMLEELMAQAAVKHKSLVYLPLKLYTCEYTFIHIFFFGAPLSRTY